MGIDTFGEGGSCSSSLLPSCPDLTGKAGYILIVNSTEDGLIFVDPTSILGGSSLVECACLSTDQVGDAVYVSGPKVGGLYSVSKVDIDDEVTPNMVAMGIIKEKISATQCFVQTTGILTGVYTGLTPGARLFVDTDGGLLEGPPPPSPTARRLYQYIAVAMSADAIMIDPQPPTRMDYA